jgi:hypothetical protein
MTQLRKETLATQGTSSFNFKEDEWKDAPPFEPTRCTGCQRVIKTATEPHSMSVGGYQCMNCVSGMGPFESVHALED